MFVPLHLKSDCSLGYGTASVAELVRRAAELGYREIALTDLENMYGQVQFHEACRLHGLRPVTGVELRRGFEPRGAAGERGGRIVLLACGGEGYRNLCRIVSRRRGAFRDPAHAPNDPLPLVLAHADDLIALTDDASVAARLLASGKFPRERLGLLLVRPGDAPARRRREEAAQLGIRIVADLDALLLAREDHPLHLLQRAVATGLPFGSAAAESAERLLLSPEEAAALFADLPEGVAATTELARLCRLELPRHRAPADGIAAEDARRLRQLCLEGKEELFPEEKGWSAAHRARLEEELALFARLGFSSFMTVVAEILAHCRTAGIAVVVRGSAVSSLVLHLLGGTPVDPLRQGLLLERFLHPGKSAWPDVDIDLPWHRRDEVIAWVYRRFGRDRVAMVAALHTFRQRSALREGLKAFGARPAEIEALSRALPPEDLAVEDVDFLDLAAALPDPEPPAETAQESLRRCLPLVRRLVGKPRHVAVHPGGIVVARLPLEELLPLERAPKGVVITQFDLVSVAHLGLVKIDLLGNRCLSELEEALAPPGASFRLSAIPREDRDTLALIDRADTIGCFQLESPAMRSLLARLPIRSEADVTAALALIRPGAAAGEVKNAFVRRARNEEEGETDFPLMADRLAQSHGMFLYEEDIMVLLARTGGIPLSEADEIRRGIVRSGGDAGILSPLRDAFLSSARRAGTDSPLARRAWSVAARFAAYSFNKAHAASFAFLAYCSAYSKAHRPVHFACALLNHHQGLYPLRTEAAALARMGVTLLPPHVNASKRASTVVPAPPLQGVRVGLNMVKGLSRRAAEAIVTQRLERPFSDLADLLRRVRLTAGERSALVLCGACDGLAPLSAAAYPFAHEAALEWLRQGGSADALAQLPVPVPAAAAPERVRLYAELVRVKNELRYLEMHLHGHPLALLREEGSRYGCRRISDAVQFPEGTLLRLAATVAAMRRVATAEGAMQFLTLEDETGLLEGALPPPVYRRLGERVETPGPFLVEGKLRRRQRAAYLEVSWLGPFHRRRRPFGG